MTRKLCAAPVPPAQPHAAPGSAPIDPALLLDIFGQQPISFHPCYVAITGSVTAALWLSYAIYHLHEQEDDNDGWFSKSQQSWEEETGLSRREQESARKRLIELGLLEERRPGLKQPLQFRISHARLVGMLQALATANWAHTDFKPSQPKAWEMGQ